MKGSILMVLAFLVALITFPPAWYPEALKVQFSLWFGASEFRALPQSVPGTQVDSEIFCPPDLLDWRDSQVIEGVTISESKPCIADNPFMVASFVKGTNNISHQTLMQSGLTADAVEKGEDLDGDGDPDVIHIRLELVELNGASGESDQPVTQYEIAPGIKPGLWVFAPKLAGMARENFESQKARSSLRVPSPVIRIEAGDQVKITLENTHYMPHTLHLHGADHGFVDADGEGNDGVPLTSELPVLPGNARTYELNPRKAGTMFYHCHVQPHVHVTMGLQGMFIVEENRPNNWLQTMNIGAGYVRVPSVAVKEDYTQEYDLHYTDLDKQLSERIQDSNDPRLVTRSMHREYDVTDATADYFLLNGKSFPYTFRESIVVVEEDENVKLRVLNGGTKGIALHTHGHKFTVTHQDGVPLPKNAEVVRDVLWLATAQRADLALSTENDGLHSYGSGIWLFHDHQNRGVTTDGIGPGGNISAIVYKNYLSEAGWPKTQGVSFKPFFTAQYYQKQIPVWQSYAPDLFSDVARDWFLFARLTILSLSLGVFFALLFSKIKYRAKPREKVL
ncbi:MAG: hypothetical protein ACJAWF_001692 [Candidatus Azotimanducaceae bacterium]|jgi:hypothetical protein